MFPSIQPGPARLGIGVILTAALYGCVMANPVAKSDAEGTQAAVRPNAPGPVAGQGGLAGEKPAGALPGATNGGSSGAKQGLVVRSPAVNDPTLLAEFPQGPGGVVRGKLVDQFGAPAVGASVKSGDRQVLVDAQGRYEIEVPSGPDVHLRFGGEGTPFVFFDHHMAVLPQAEAEVNTEVLALDPVVTPIKSGQAGMATSSDLATVLANTNAAKRTFRAHYGLLQQNTSLETKLEAKGLKAVYMTIPDGAIIGDAKVRLTWLNPMPRPARPNGDLFGPLQTYTEWDPVTQSGTQRTTPVKFAPVNFASIELGPTARIAPGATVKLKWVVSPEVLQTYPIQMVAGKAFFPCFTYNRESQTWDIPVLAEVFEENGFTWAEYSMRGSTPPAVSS